MKRKHALSAPYARDWQPARRPALGRHGEFDEYDSAHHLPPVPALKRRRGCQGGCSDLRRRQADAIGALPAVMVEFRIASDGSADHPGAHRQRPTDPIARLRVAPGFAQLIDERGARILAKGLAADQVPT